MPLVPVLLTNFTSGELSPRLAGRVDVSKYFNGCQSLENFLAQPHGGVVRRSGMRFVAEAACHSGASLLVPYEDASGTAWVLEFAQGANGACLLRFFTGGGRALDAAGGPLELATPYAQEHLKDLGFVQDRYSLILCHPHFAPRRLARTASGGFALAEAVFVNRPGAWGEGNWPAQCCLHEDRLVFAATPEEPFTLWFSRTGSHDDFRLATREVPLTTGTTSRSRTQRRHAFRRRPGDTVLLLPGTPLPRARRSPASWPTARSATTANGLAQRQGRHVLVPAHDAGRHAFRRLGDRVRARRGRSPAHRVLGDVRHRRPHCGGPGR